MSVRRVGKMGLNNTQSRTNSLQIASGLPGPPTNVTTTITGNTTATVTWTAPVNSGESSITSYTVSGGGSVSIAGTTATITGLSANTTYIFEVSANNSLGRGKGTAADQKTTTNWNAATGGTETTISNYNGTGQTWKRHTFTSNGTLNITNAGQPFRVLVVGGGGGGAAYDGNFHGNGGSGGFDTQNDNATIAVGSYAVTVGGGGGNPGEGTWSYGGTGGQSSIGTIFTANGGAGGNPPGVNNGNYSYGASNGGTSTISGASVTYGSGGPPDHPPGYSPGTNTGNGGSGGHTGRGDPSGPRYGTGGAAGIVIVSYRVL